MFCYGFYGFGPILPVGNGKGSELVVLQELHDATENMVQDKSLWQPERLSKVRPCRYKALQQIREIRSENQKKNSISVSKGHTLKCMAT